MKKPNFLVIVADDMGFSDAGCYGGEISTPNLDALAARGVRFTQHYSTGRCWPSRACILTGNYYQQLPAVSDDGRIPNWGRPAPHYLRPLGYRSYHSGKWHLKQFPAPVAHGGFDRSYDIRDFDRHFAVSRHNLDDRPLPPVEPDSGYYSSTAVAEHAIAFLKEHARRHAGRPFFLYLAPIAPHFPLHASQEDIACYRGRYDCGWDAIRQQRMKRLMDHGIVHCGLSPRQPNTRPRWNLSAADLANRIGPGEAARAVSWRSLTPQQRYLQARKMEIHAAMIHRLDREAGRVIDQVKAMGMWENTVTLFVSDNGASAEQIIRGDGHDKGALPGSGESYLCLGPGWSTAANTPFRYHKSWVHEGGVASPLIVHWPGGLKARGELRHAPSHFVDILPTMLELAGQKTAPDWRATGAPPLAGTDGFPSGVDVRSSPLGLCPPRRGSGGGKSRPRLAGTSLARVIREDRDTDREYIYFRHIGHRALRVGRWKLVAVYHGQWELYDMQADRSELRNLAKKHPDRVEKMSALWHRCSRTFARQSGARAS